MRLCAEMTFALKSLKGDWSLTPHTIVTLGHSDTGTCIRECDPGLDFESSHAVSLNHFHGFLLLWGLRSTLPGPKGLHGLATARAASSASPTPISQFQPPGSLRSSESLDISHHRAFALAAPAAGMLFLCHLDNSHLPSTFSGESPPSPSNSMYTQIYSICQSHN
jgi:hypothetical protein